jgi:hypothetical protein
MKNIKAMEKVTEEEASLDFVPQLLSVSHSRNWVADLDQNPH